MFRLVIPQHLPLPITVQPPDGGEGRFIAHMRYLSVQERLNYLQRIQEPGMTDQQIVADLLVGWEGLCGEDGQPLPGDDPDIRAHVLDIPFLYEPIRDAILGELIYRHQPAGNSPLPPDDGRQAAATATSG